MFYVLALIVGFLVSWGGNLLGCQEMVVAGVIICIPAAIRLALWFKE